MEWSWPQTAAGVAPGGADAGQNNAPTGGRPYGCRLVMHLDGTFTEALLAALDLLR